MIRLCIKQTRISLEGHDILVQGCVNSVFVHFSFSHEWDSLACIAVFNNGSTKVSVSLSSDTCIIPWEVLSSPGDLYISLRGVGESGTFVICTEDIFIGKIIPSSAFCEAPSSKEVMPDVIDTLLADVAEIKAALRSQDNSLFQK